jgi:hypothetical protein
MAVPVLLLLLVSAFAGLVAGRRRAVLPAAAAIAPCALLGGAGVAGLALMATMGVAGGVHLHRVVADNTPPPRAG